MFLVISVGYFINLNSNKYSLGFIGNFGCDNSVIRINLKYNERKLKKGKRLDIINTHIQIHKITFERLIDVPKQGTLKIMNTNKIDPLNLTRNVIELNWNKAGT